MRGASSPGRGYAHRQPGRRILTEVGVIANPASGRDIRRLVGGASVFDNAEKGAMVYRLMVGLHAAGVERVVMMPAGSGLSESLRRILRGQSGPAAGRGPELELLDTGLNGTAADTVAAAEAMRARAVGAIVVLGGDGTNRLVARHCGEIPLCPLSTGTNNAFPSVREATVAGIATGLVATGRLGSEALRREKLLRVETSGGLNGAAADVALVDVARTHERFVGARAIWRPETIAEAVVAFAEPGAVGLSALAALLDPVPRDAPGGLHVVFGEPASAPCRLLAPLVPGLVVPVGVESARRVEPGKTVALGRGAGSVALDGEREIEIDEGDTVSVTLTSKGPLTIDVERGLLEASRRELLRLGDGMPRLP